MYTYHFTTKNGKAFSAKGKDADRARVVAKKAAGAAWEPSAKLTRITNAI